MLISSKFACYYKVSGVDSRLYKQFERPLSAAFNYLIHEKQELLLIQVYEQPKGI